MDPTGASGSQPNTFVNRILRVALGLFVTTAELPQLTPEQAGDLALGYGCSFESACRWSSTGGTSNRWFHAKGEPESLIWLAATGTMTIPREPFTLIELRGQPADSLTSDVIPCQNDNGLLSFTYWTIGNADLEICLLDENKMRFNCTGMLQSHIQPKTVSLTIPAIHHPFHISLIPNTKTGVLVLDDIQYQATFCSSSRGRPVDLGRPWVPPTPPVTEELGLPWTPPAPPVTEATILPPFVSSIFPPLTTLPPTMPPITFFPITDSPTVEVSSAPTIVTIPPMVTKTEPPFELFIVGNRTRPLFDRRRGEVIDDVNSLVCDFGGKYDCFWGAEAGRWALIEEGAVPLLNENKEFSPSYPAALVIQGITAMLTSDPIRCQTDSGTLIFRYWTNGNVLLQSCALGHEKDSTNYQCTEQIAHPNLESGSMAMFNFNESIFEPFTLNILPMWETTAKDNFLIIDEIAYMGKCEQSTGSHRVITTEQISTTSRPVMPAVMTRFVSPFVPPEATTSIPRIITTKRWVTTPRYEVTTTTEAPLDYCKILNCNFDDSACSYLNHGLTRVPWTLRNRGYGLQLSKTTDIRSNGGQPTHAITIRLCLGTTNTKPLRTVASFTQCPPILRSLTPRTAYKWNGVHISIPPGTTHFYLVAHNLDKSSEKAAIAIDNIRVAICDPRPYDTDASDPIFQES
ncbi:hypothetical protein FO519_000782 [Halicephalobus sp. NKZ332]|nr:hypothetical protein FO519_000782 [Halicephalobus sp. NKZ332]